MGRCDLNNWKVLVCLLLVLTACRADKLSKKSTNTFVNGAQRRAQSTVLTLVSAEDAHRHYSKIADSIASDTAIYFNKIRAFAVKSLLSPKWLELCDGELLASKETVLDAIEVFPFNGHFLVTIVDYDLTRNFCKSTHVYWIDESHHVIDSMILMGAKHDEGSVSIEDVDGNGKDDIWYRVRVQSASVNSGCCEVRLVICHNRRLVMLAEFTEESWDCTPIVDQPYDHRYCKVKSVNHEKLVLSVEERWTNCWNEIWKGEPASTKLIRAYEQVIYLKDRAALDDNIRYNVVTSTAECAVFRKDTQDSGDFLLERYANGHKLWEREINNISPYARLDNVYENYISLGFICGGPCFGKTLVFNSASRSPETYGNAYIVPQHEHLILYVENEEFEYLRIRNLNNNRVMEVRILDSLSIDTFPYAVVDLQLNGSNLSFCLLFPEGSRRKLVSLAALL